MTPPTHLRFVSSIVLPYRHRDLIGGVMTPPYNFYLS